MRITLSICLVLALMFPTMVGCGSGEGATEAKQSEAEHDHGEEGHDHGAHGHSEPKNFGEALAKVEAMKVAICEAFTAGKPDDAHGDLHEVGHALEGLPDLASKAGELSDEAMEKVNASVEAMFDAFGQLDDTMHGGPEVEIADVEKKLTDAIAELKELVGHDHDHEHEDEHGHEH